ncbi:hypothetical protein V6R86_03615 [Sphingomonas kaistensis]|uniref:Secreted protein n=1 Tax=Sphingomonas kaistensis TaxID=298708 RepID=A0ABZ2FYU4_9SPHN
MILSLLAFALAAQPVPSSAPEVATAPKEKKICRSEVDTGTRVNRRRTCATKQQWEERRQEQIDSMAVDRSRAERSAPCTSLPCR